MNLKRRQELFLDGMETSLTMAMVAYSRLHRAVSEYSGRVRANPRESVCQIAELILLDAWSLVDIINRLRVLVRQTPGLKRNAYVKAFLSAVGNVEALRNCVQHLDGEAVRLAESGWPIWGSLSWVWVSPQMQEEGTVAMMSIIPGRLGKSGGYPIVNPVGRKIQPPVDHILLSAAGSTVNLSEVFRASMVFGRRLGAALGRARDVQFVCRDEQEVSFLEIILDCRG